MSINAQITAFNTALEALLASLNTKKLNTYVFLDSNINLLHYNTDLTVSLYHDTIFNNGFLQIVTRATRMHNNNFSLIDHILTNSPSTETKSGILISDISDHFFTFTLPNYSTNHQPRTLLGTSAQQTLTTLNKHLGQQPSKAPLAPLMQMKATMHSG